MLLDFIESYRSIIQNWQIEEYDSTGPHLRFKVRIHFCDGSILFIRQIILAESVFKYAYHWQDSNGHLRCRWDNAPHWLEIATFPHHKHLLQDDKEIIVCSKGGDLTDIFQEIASYYKEL
ncbi:MAG: hypothetical protein BWK78_09585 [Thiotrichaceae bacterium IS1]|nr:MAG: hypothetical protein BWK78_09585 [Thiotrichaceae bacterium IS1]